MPCCGCSPFRHQSAFLCSHTIPRARPTELAGVAPGCFLDSAGSTACGRKVTFPTEPMKRICLVALEKSSDVQNKKKTEDFFVNSQLLCEGDSVVTLK